MPGQTGPRARRKSNLVGEYLRSLREHQELPIRKVTAALDRTDAWLHRVEAGRHSTDLKSLYDVVIFLEGDFFHALICLCRDEGVPEEAVGRIAALGSASLSSSKATRAKTGASKG